VFKVCERAGLSSTDLTAIGCHGHTMWHIPPENGMRGSTLQLGDPATVAELTGVTVVSDFRSRDMAAGGHGAPLVVWPDWLLYSAPNQNRALHNIGGMSNVTWLPQSGSPEPLVAFDTGPGMALIDEVARRATNNESPFDVGGEMAQRGIIDEDLLTSLLDDGYFRSEPPKTTGRERYGRAYVDRLTDNMVSNSKDVAWYDLIATLTALTVRSIGEAYRRWIIPLGVDEIFLMGGGSRNRVLTDSLREELAPIPVKDGKELGVDPDAREALAFAVLTWAHLHGVPANVPCVTGACGPRVLGSLTPGACL
jgi:anhydro-N-acetylmuramic acid kinase